MDYLDEIIVESTGDVTLEKEQVNTQVEQATTSSEIVATSDQKKNKKKKKNKSVFRNEWLSNSQYSLWLAPVKQDSFKARCKACLKTISIESGGKADVDKHMCSNGHKVAMKNFRQNALITTLLTPTSELDKISAAEGALVFHGVKHGHSYRSQECTVNLTKVIFESSPLAKSLSCARTKARSIVCHVLAPFFTEKLIDEVLNVGFYSLSFDASNKGNRKTYPFAVQYMTDTGVKRGKSDELFIVLLCQQLCCCLLLFRNRLIHRRCARSGK
jgi:hypothetical protein